MSNSKCQLILGAALIAAPTTVFAQIQQSRCSTDSLSVDQAKARLEWARKCSLTLNTAGPNTTITSVRGYFINSNGMFVGAPEYVESNTSRAYTGNTNFFEINYSYGSSLYSTPVYAVARDSSGPTLNFWRWSQVVTNQRERPLYPTFDSDSASSTGIQLFPNPTLLNTTNPSTWQTVDCNLYQKDAFGNFTQYTGGVFYVSAYCESSCYTPDQNLRFSDGDVNILEAMKARRNDLVTLTPDATLDNLTTQVSNVYSYTAEIRDAEQVIHEVTTASGGSLSVTTEHPLLTSTGRLVRAEALKAGRDELIKADGTPDPVVRVEKTKFFGKVYNIKPVPTERVANILIAQGYLVGSARFQNDYVNYVNRVLLFRAVPHDVMPK